MVVNWGLHHFVLKVEPAGASIRNNMGKKAEKKRQARTKSVLTFDEDARKYVTNNDVNL